MTIFLVIVSLYGGIEVLPMKDIGRCQFEANTINAIGAAKAHCVWNGM